MALVAPMCDHTTYNNLLYLGEADTKFTERESILSKISTLLSKYKNKWSICLVHRHCELQSGEIMLERAFITEPIVLKDDSSAEVYPERWLATGQGYEFTTRPTETPPPSLFDDFRGLIGKEAIQYLGLYYADPDSDSAKDREWLVEHTEGRKNIVEKVMVQPVPSATMLEAAWLFAEGTKRPDYCTQYCHQEQPSGNHTSSTHVITAG